MTITETIEKLATYYDKHQNETRLQIDLVKDADDNITHILFCEADKYFDTDDQRVVADIDNTKECTLTINGVIPNQVLDRCVVHLARTPIDARVEQLDLKLDLSQYDLKHLASIKVNLGERANQSDKLELTDDQMHALRHFRTAYNKAKAKCAQVASNH